SLKAGIQTVLQLPCPMKSSGDWLLGFSLSGSNVVHLALREPWFFGRQRSPRMVLASLYSWLRHKTSSGKTRTNPPRRPRALPLSLELLESRVVPTNQVTWVGGATGSWGLASNWSDGTVNRLPTASDDVSIGAGITVTHSTGTDAVHSIVDQGSLTLS